MHKIVSDLITQRQATGYPTKRAIHASDQAYDTAEYHKKQFSRWSECGFSAVKLMAATDSQVNTIIEANKVHYKPVWIIRFYGNQAPNDMIDTRTVKLYVDRGVQFFEATANEFNHPDENAWPGTVMPSDWPQQIARQYANQANAILGAGGVPITPAIETWNMDIFTRLFDELATHHRDVLMQSVVGIHSRTLNHPPSYGLDSSCYRGWEDCDDYLQKLLGEPLPIIATEAGPEPLWDMDKTYPPVSIDMHSTWVKEILSWSTPDWYLFDCLWEWKGRGAFERASYIENPLMAGKADLPVVRMLATWRPEALTPVLTDEYVRAIGQRYPSAISLNPGAALYKAAQEAKLGQGETSEWEQDGFIWQKFQYGVVVVPKGEWDKTRVVKWSS